MHPTLALAPARANGFGLLRLVFACLVIHEHVGFLAGTPAPTLGAVGFGAVAVDGFFLVSGYLITSSVRSSPPANYLWKRVLRIYPAFIVCSLLLLFIVRPLAGGSLPRPAHWGGPLVWMALLHQPVNDGAFAGLPSSHLDGSMWTIAYEFRCYLLALLFRFAGLYQRPRLYLSITATLLALHPCLQLGPLRGWDYTMPWWLTLTAGAPVATVRLLGLFMAGGCFHLFQPRLSGRIALFCAVLLAALVSFPTAAEVALATAGSYLLFWIALRVEWKPLRTLNTRSDISYGVYLYGWPVTNLLLWFRRDIPVAALLVITVLVSFALGALSWHAIEKPALAFKQLRLRPT